MHTPPKLYLVDRRDADDAEPSSYHVVKVLSGQCHISTQPHELLVSVLGSCVATCLRDPVAKIGGMNHFLLPGDDLTSTPISNAERYGVYAMESLINGILKAGGKRERLEAKVFGGGNVIRSIQRVGSKNALFAKRFLETEKIPILSEDLEGTLPRRIHFFPETGKVMMRRLKRHDDQYVVAEELRYRSLITEMPVEGTIDLF